MNNLHNYDYGYEKAKSILGCFDVLLIIEIVLIFCEIIDSIVILYYRIKFLISFIEILNHNKYFHKVEFYDFYFRLIKYKTFDFIFLIILLIVFLVLILILIMPFKKFNYIVGCCKDNVQPKKMKINIQIIL